MFVAFIRIFLFFCYVLQVKLASVFDCGGSVELYAQYPFYLESPDFIKTDTQCDWNIKVPFGKQIEFVFEEFNLFTDPFNCSDFYFQIEDINGVNRYCQSTPIPKSYLSSGPFVQARLYSGEPRLGGEGIRVRLHYQVAPCHAFINGVNYGTIFSPDYPEYYPNDKICTWKLQVPVGFAIFMDCTRYKFWIENSVNCLSDILLISLTGREDLADAVGFCGRRAPPPFRTYGNTLTILFKSNPWYHYTGFRCDFQSVPIGTPTGPPTVAPPTNPNACGVCGIGNDQTARVVGGSETRPNQYPWTVAIFQTVPNSSRLQQYCGGSLLNDRYVLSAAHCFRNRVPSGVRIGLGEHNITAPERTSAIKVGVSQIIINPNWGTTRASSDNDIAIVKLARSIQYNDRMRPICLPPMGSNFEGITATVAGWGRYEIGGNRSSAVLRATDIQVLPLTDCTRAYGANQITNNMVCAATANPIRDACPGDSGGPLTWFSNGRWYLIGVVSAGDPRGTCGNPQFPGIYTRVSNYLEWIGQNIQADSNCSAARESSFGSKSDNSFIKDVGNSGGESFKIFSKYQFPPLDVRSAQNFLKEFNREGVRKEDIFLPH